jgi:hypothetical protein
MIRRLLFLLALLPAGLQAQASSLTPSNAFIKEAYAITTCRDGQPVTDYRADTFVDTLLMAELVVHEQVHRRQFAPDSTGTCEEKFAQATSDVDHLLAIEAPAYCAQLQFVVNRDGPIPMLSLLRVIQVLAGFYQVPPGRIVDEFRKAGCDPYPEARRQVTPAVLQGTRS